MSDAGEPIDRQLLMVGVPGTGKTSFLALFYLALTHARGTKLRLASWFAEREYLNEIGDALLHCEEVERTAHEAQGELDLPLETATGSAMRLHVPDLSGEIWEDALVQRRWSAELDQLVHQAQAKIVFLHATKIEAGASINAVHRLTEILGAPPAGARSRPALAPTPETNVELASPPSDHEAPGQDPATATVEVEDIERPEGSAERPTIGSDRVFAGERTHGGLPGCPPTQVDLVDLVQLTCEQRGPDTTRLCILISAWDEAPAGVAPAEFVAQSLPLLWQYLEANSSWLECRIYGISAQGGRFDTLESREKLADQDPIQRAIVKTADGDDANVGGIVEWALSIN